MWYVLADLGVSLKSSICPRKSGTKSSKPSSMSKTSASDISSADSFPKLLRMACNRRRNCDLAGAPFFTASLREIMALRAVFLSLISSLQYRRSPHASNCLPIKAG